jgi:hypothetical protein
MTKQKDPLELLASVRAIASMSAEERELAEVIDQVEERLIEEYGEFMPDDWDGEIAQHELDDMLGRALLEVDPDARYSWDIMGERTYESSQWYDHLGDVAQSVLPERSRYTCPDCKRPTTVSVRGEAFVKFDRDGSESLSEIEVYPENMATCDLCGHETELRNFQ